LPELHVQLEKIVVAPMLFNKWVPHNPWQAGAYIVPCGETLYAPGPVLLCGIIFLAVTVGLIVAIVVLACDKKRRELRLRWAG